MPGFVHKTIGEVIRDTAQHYPQADALIRRDFGVHLNYKPLLSGIIVADAT